MERDASINWRKTPFIRLILPLIAGILCAIYLKLAHFYWSIPFGVLVATLVYLFYQRKIAASFSTNYVFGITLYVALFFGGINLTIFRTEYNFESHYLHTLDESIYQHNIIVEIEDIPKNKPNSIYTLASVKAIDNNGVLQTVKGSVIIYFEKDSASNTILQGDQLLIQSHLQNISKPQNPDEFDYSQYLYFHQIYQQTYVSAGSWQPLAKGGWSLKKIAGKSRDFLLAILKDNGLEGEQLSVASALILGYKDDLSDDLKHAYSSTGAMHVLAVSGLHVGIIFMVLNNLLKFMDKSRKLQLVKVVFLLAFLWFYAFITGLSPSVIRASTMFSFVILGGVFNRTSSIYNTLASSGFVLLCYDPYLIMEVGFQLSYLAVLGIVYFQPLLYKRWYTKNWLLDKIWGITSVSIAAQIATFPLGLLYFHQFPVYFLFSNLVVIPGAMLIIGLGILLFATSSISFIAFYVGWLLNEVIYGMNYLVKAIDQLPFSLIEGVSISILGCWLVYGIIVSFVPIFEFRKLKYFNLSLGLLILFITLDSVEDASHRKNSELVLYAIKNEVAINFIDQQNNYFFGSEKLISSSSSMQFHIKNHWDSKDAVSPTYLDVNADYQIRNSFVKAGPFFIFNNKAVLQLSNKLTYNSFELNQNLPLEVLYVTEYNADLFIQVTAHFNISTLVVGNAVSKYDANELILWCTANNVKYHVIREEGAFVMQW